MLVLLFKDTNVVKKKLKLILKITLHTQLTAQVLSYTLILNLTHIQLVMQEVISVLTSADKLELVLTLDHKISDFQK
jgi:hypothetical protein